MRRLIYVTNVRLPTHRAHGLQVMKMCEAFADAGVDVQLIAPNLKPTVQENPFRYYGVRRTFSVHKIPVLELVPWQRWLGQWVAYVENISFALSAVAYFMYHGLLRGDHEFYSRDYTVAFVMALLGCQFSLEVHDYRPKEPKRRLRYVFRHARHIITNSEGTRDTILAHYALPPGKVSSFTNGVDPNFFRISLTREEARRMFRLPEQGAVIAYVGRLEILGMEKGVLTLIRAFAKLRMSIADAVLVIAGGPPEQIERYRHVARNVGLSDSAILFTGHVAYSLIPALYRAIDVAVIPLPAGQHATTTSPIKLFEYMSAGKTILASDLPSLRRVLDETNAEFFLPSDEVSLEEQIRMLLEDPRHASMLAQKAQADSIRYSWGARAKKILSVIHV